MTRPEHVENLEKLLNKLEKDRSIYNWASIILSILDVICGLVCIAYSSLLITSVVVSALTGAVIAGRTVQIIKAERLAKTLGVVLGKSWVRRIFSACALFLTTRIKRSNTKMAKWLKANKWSIITGIIACGVTAGAVWFAIAMYWIAAPLWAAILITCASGLLSGVGVYFLGAEKWTAYVLRISAKRLKKEDSEKLIEVSDQLFSVAKAKEEQEKADKENQELALKEARAELEAKQKAELELLAKEKLIAIKNSKN